MQSTAINENDDNIFLEPDQDHDYLFEQESDLQLVKAKFISMNIEMNNKDTIINEKKNNFELAQSDIEALNLKENELEKSNKNKTEALDIANGKFNSIEGEKACLQKRLMKYSAMIKQLSLNKVDDKKEEKVDKANGKLVYMKKTLKQKNK